MPLIKKSWHAATIAEVFKELGSSKVGLSSEEAERRLTKYGPNILPESEPFNRLEIFLNQFKSPFVWILLVATGVSLTLADYASAWVILAALAINISLGFYQELKANRALAELQKFLAARATVIRDSSPLSIDIRLVAPGDILVLSPGDKIASDARLFETHSFEVNEAPLTGESFPISKTTEVLNEGTALSDRRNMVYSGTSVALGRALAVTTGTGAKTEFGSIALEIQAAKEQPTPLQNELARLSRMLGIIFVGLASAILVIGLLQGRSFIEMFTTSVAVAVAAVPEGLPLAVTAILAIGMRRILKHKALVRKLVAAETLGSATTICVDKTGTITEGEMKVSHIWTPEEDEASTHSGGMERHAVHLLALRIGLLCNDALVRNPEAELKNWEILGDAMDRALFLAAREAGLDQAKLLKETPRLDELPFDSRGKFMATLHKIESHAVIYLKGAPEVLLRHSAYESLGGRSIALTEESRKRIRGKIEGLTKRGLRTIAVGYRLAGEMKRFSDGGVSADDFVFVGVFGLRDPVRPGVAETIRLTAKAGVKIVMITGDHKETARAVAREVGIPYGEENVMDGVFLDRISDEELRERSERIFIYARVESRHKVRIVEALRIRGEVVAMTGDGVNDAPAIKSAHIGIALASGTDVVKEVSDVVLLDNNLKTIVAAVRQGRIIFENIKKVVLYLLASSFSEVILIAGSLFLRLPLPLLPAQILWVNLVEDSFPNIALAFDPGRKEIMNEPPRTPGTSLANSSMRYLVAIIAVVTDTAMFGMYYLFLKTGLELGELRTIMFAAIGLDSLFFIYVIRSERRPFWQTNPLSNPFITLSVFLGFGLLAAAVYVPFLQRILHTAPLGSEAWTLVISLAILKMFFIEMAKRFLMPNFKKYESR